MSDATCLWCCKPFHARETGGKPQRFCSTPCRRALDRAARNWVIQQVEGGLVPVSYLRECHQDNARVAPVSKTPLPAPITIAKSEDRTP